MPNRFDAFAHPEHIQLTGRSREIARLRAIYDGRQYEGRPDWWTGSRDGKPTTKPAPLRQRKPCIIYRLPKAAVEQTVRFLFGDGRFPQISIKATIEEIEQSDGTKVKRSTALGGVDLEAEDAEHLQTWIAECIDRSRLQPVMRMLAKGGIACRTGIAALSFVEGEFCLENLLPEHCVAKFERDDPTAAVLRLVQCYQYQEEIATPEGKPESKTFLFRREWDERACYTYEPVELKPGEKVKWGAASATEHGFSFCPIVWIPNSAHQTNSCDGLSLFEDSEDEIEALDFALSQRHRGLAYLGTPQLVETGVRDGDGPAAVGSKAVTVGGDVYRPPGESTGEEVGGIPARRTGPLEVWTYEGEKVNVSLLETSGKAFEVASLHVDDMRSRLLETWGVVLTSMRDTVSRISVGAEMSARFLALAHAPLLGLVSELRHVWWPLGLQAILEMLMRMVAELGGKGVLIPGSDKTAQVLQRFLKVDADGVKIWMPPKLEPVWGEYFTLSEAEIKEAVESAGKAHDGQLVAHKTAARHVAQSFDVGDVTAELQEIEQEAEEARQKAQEDMTAQAEAEAHALHQATRGADAGAGSQRGREGAGTQPPRTGNSRGGAGAAAPEAR